MKDSPARASAQKPGGFPVPLGTGRRILNLQEAEKERTFIFSRLFNEEFPGARKRAKARRAALRPKAQGGKFRIESEEKPKF